MTLTEAAVVLAGALAGGFVNGLTGFGTGLVAIGVWLHVLPPAVAASLVIVSSVIAQIQTLPLIWGRIDWGRALPFVLPGVIGVPAGAAMLGLVDVATFKVAVGVFLASYAALALARRSAASYAIGGRAADAAVGLASGWLGGLSGLSGALMVLWTDVRGGDKAERRTLLQVFNLVVLLAALGAHAWQGHLTAAVGLAVLVTLPGTLLGAALGARAYAALADHNYRRIVLVLLLISGIGLVVAHG